MLSRRQFLTAAAGAPFSISCGRYLPPQGTVTPRPISAGAAKAYELLNDAMDATAKRQPIYIGADNGWNILYGSDWLNGAPNMKMDSACRVQPLTGPSCIRIVLLPGEGVNSGYWNGVVFHNAKTWNGELEAPFDLSGATRFVVRLRTDQPGLRVQLLFNDINLPSSWTEPLTKDWTQYSIDLGGKDLSKVQKGMSLIIETDNRQNAPAPGPPYTVYVEDAALEFAKPRALGPRLLASFHARSQAGSPFLLNERAFAPAEPGMRNVAYLYDVSCAILAFLAKPGAPDIPHARALCDALLYHQDHDRSFHDGRLRNGPMAGPVPMHPGEAARLSGWWDNDQNRWVEDMRCAGSNSGDLAWAVIALTRMTEVSKDPKYLLAATRLGDWMLKNCLKSAEPGFLGGLEGWEHDGVPEHVFPVGQRPAAYRSTEMNLDCIAAFAGLFKHTKDVRHRDAARSARKFVDSMFGGEGRFMAGTGPDPEGADNPWKVNESQKPLDTNCWALAVLGVNKNTTAGIRWAEKYCATKDGPGGFGGFAFSPSDTTGVWIEGTGQQILAYEMLGEQENASRYLKDLRRIQAASPGGKGLVASTKDGLWTGFDADFAGARNKISQTRWNYYSIVHVAATCWYLFADLQINPFYGTPAAAGVPAWAAP